MPDYLSRMEQNQRQLDLNQKQLERQIAALLIKIDCIDSTLDATLKRINASESDIEDLEEFDADSITSSVLALKECNASTQETLAEIFGAIEKLEKKNRRDEYEKEFKLSNPSFASSVHIGHPQHPDQYGNQSQLSQASGRHLRSETCSHVSADQSKPGTSHCTPCGSSPCTLSRLYTRSRQTNIGKEPYAQLLSRLLSLVWERLENSNPVFGLSLDEFFLKSTLWLECHVAQYEDRIHIQFLDGSHPRSVHSELILHRNSRST